MILFYIAEAFKIFRRASLASIIAVISTTFAVALITLSVMFLFLSDSINERLKRHIEMNVFLEVDIGTNDLDSLKTHFMENDLLGSAVFISQEEAINRFIEQTGEDFRSVLELNPLPASFVLRLKSQYVSEINLLETIEIYKAFPGVEEVKCDFETALSILGFIEKGSYVIYLLTTILILIALYFVYSTHRLWVLSKEKHFNTMKLVGAKISSIKIPIILNGLLIGMISGILCLFMIFIILEVFEGFYRFNIIETYQYLLFGIVLIGGLLGLISSLLSTRSISLKISQT